MTSIRSNFKNLLSSQGLNITSRSLAAILGGYLLAATACALLALIIPLPAFESTVTASMLSFSFYTAAVIWVFTVKHHLIAWRDLLIASGLFYLIILLVG
ncbi:hypothetical protein [Shewanella youngdeokensis]|uniref:Iron transporter n=1 Tax=Shewanella youngdeokensis TaxID=2999068 RepID=A0ABZ0JV47_9GAMM|nr:hypothetical protein RGE70_12645 [Shewanella sp. DAU334]